MKYLLPLIFICCAVREQPKHPTYSQHIRPLFLRTCSTCHNESTPHRNWLKYSVALEHKDVIMERAVIKRDMPPGGMADSERNMIRIWIEQGCVE